MIEESGEGHAAAGEDLLIDRARQVISQWIDTPSRPFMRMKQSGMK
ncbi:MAG: hypothetical protein K9J85_05915 [Desulfobacteraceae bacterium]|nr:hypothetical protein [Desulfobacteraceae bacterium]